MTLRNRVFSAVRWTTFAGVSRALLNIAQVSVLARLLQPEDYGLMAMVSVTLAVTSAFADLGVNSAYIQKSNVSDIQRSSLYWLNILVSLVITLIIVAGSPLLAAFFGDDRLTPLLMLSATTVIIGAFGQQLRISAEKQLNFRPVVYMEICAIICGFVFAVVTALADWGVYSLVMGSIVTALVNSLLAWTLVSSGWRPLLRLKLNDIRPFIGFGGAVVANKLVQSIGANLDLLMAGRLIPASNLGLYSVPRNISLQIQFLVNPIVTRVGFPLISRVQHDIARVRSVYLATLNMTSSTNAPIYLGLAFFAPEILAILLGGEWSGSVELFRILAIWSLLRSTGNPMGSLLLGVGKANLALWSNLVLVSLQAPLIWKGLQYDGPYGMVCSMLIFQVLVFAPKWYFLVRPFSGIRLLDYADAALRPMMIATLAIFPAYLCVADMDSAVTRLALAIAIAAPAYVLLSALVNRIWVTQMLQLAGFKGQA